MSTLPVNGPSTPSMRPIIWCLATFVLLLLPLIWLGPGRDQDSFLVIDTTVKPLLAEGVYVPSRFTGNPTHEFGAALAYAVGGVAFSNFASLVMGVLTALAFLKICREFAIPQRTLLLTALLFHPIYFYSASCTIDYLWAMAGILWGYLLLRDGRWLGAGVLFGLAVGARLASGVPIAALAITVIICTPRRWISVALCAAVALLCAALLYYPGYRYYGSDAARLLSFGQGSWSLMGHVARALIRNAYFWGIQTLPLVAMGVFLLWQRRRDVFVRS